MFSLLISLFLSFFRIGLFGFGGGYAMLALIEREIIQAHQWLNVGEFVDLIALAEMTPGPVAINAATFVGYQVAGPAGAVTATLGVIFPSLILVIPAAKLLTLCYRHQGLQKALLGIHPAVLSLIGLAAFLIGKNAIIDMKSAAVAAGGLLLLMFTRVHPLILLAIGAVAGMLLYH